MEVLLHQSALGLYLLVYLTLDKLFREVESCISNNLEISFRNLCPSLRHSNHVFFLRP